MTLLRANDGRSTLTLPAGECKQCGKEFIKFNSMQQLVCSGACGQKYARSLRVTATNTIKAEKRETKQKLDALKPRSHWLKAAQDAFNGWIRARDDALGCISCGTRDGKVNAGHYLSTGARPELRFEPLNVHRQCERCNTYLHGNLIAYRAELIRRVGVEVVELLEGPHPPKKYTADDLKEIAADYRARRRQLLKERE